MTEPDTPLSPEEEEVRRLLARARHTEPAPPEVVARLDRVLADLAAEPARDATVVRLATRRRRVASLLVAAAAVVAVGIGIGQLGEPGGSDDQEPATTAGQAEDAEGGADAESPSAGNGAPEEHQVEGTVPSSGAELSELRTVDPQAFSADVRDTRAQVAGPVTGLLDGTDSSLARNRSKAANAAGAACGAAAWGNGAFVPVRYGRTPAVLAFRPARGNTQVVDLFYCGSERPVRSVTLPAP